MRNVRFFLILLFCIPTWAEPSKIQNFLFIGGDDPKTFESKLTDKIDGVQIIYTWKSLESEKDKYDFQKIENDLTYLNLKGKKLWVQLQDRFFEAKARRVPDYILNDAIYEGGLARQKDNPGENLPAGTGWVSKQWNSPLQQRYQKLIFELAKKFDGRIYGINLPESAADVDIKLEEKSGFTCDKYFQATLENINFTKSSFKKSYVVQYVNFWPCEWENDKTYMSRFFKNAEEKGVGLGGPDVVPYRKGQMKNSYPFFNKYKGKLSIVAFAVQEPTRTYTNPKIGKRFTEDEFLEFAEGFLGAGVVFWSVEVDTKKNF